MLKNVIKRGNLVYFTLNNKPFHMEEELFNELGLNKEQLKEEFYLAIDNINESYYITTEPTEYKINQYFTKCSIEDLQTELVSKTDIIVAFETKEKHKRIYKGKYVNYIEDRDIYLFLTDNNEFKSIIPKNIKMIFRLDNKNVYEL